MQIATQQAELYAAKFCSQNDAALYQFHKNILENHPQQHLQSSWEQGMLLSFLSQLQQPKYILEIGTFTGFSAMCLAKGLTNDGELHSIELREENAKKAKDNFKISSKQNQILLHCGNATEIIPELHHQWDLVFIDADKTNYINYYNLVLPQLAKNGIIIVDNVLFHGQVFEENISGKNAKAIHSFNEYVKADETVEQVVLTVRDGLMLIKKK